MSLLDAADLLGARVMAEEGTGEKLARLDERMKVVEAELKSLNAKLWAGLAVILAYVGQQFLGMLGKG